MRKFLHERLQEERGELPSVFQHNFISRDLMIQLKLLWLQEFDYLEDFVADTKLHSCLCISFAEEELGDGYSIGNKRYSYWSALRSIVNFFERTNFFHFRLTIIDELTRLCLPRVIEQINMRMRRAGFGYMHDGENLVRIEDETYLEEVTSKAISILNKDGYKECYEHFIKTYEFLKNDELSEALTSSGKAIESILKTRLKGIVSDDLDNKNWRDLRKYFKERVVIPDYMENYIDNLLNVVEGVATSRNKEGGHGKSEGYVLQADELFIRYIINQTAANILFIAEAEFKK